MCEARVGSTLTVLQELQDDAEVDTQRPVGLISRSRLVQRNVLHATIINRCFRKDEERRKISRSSGTQSSTDARRQSRLQVLLCGFGTQIRSSSLQRQCATIVRVGKSRAWWSQTVGLLMFGERRRRRPLIPRSSRRTNASGRRLRAFTHPNKSEMANAFGAPQR